MKLRSRLPDDNHMGGALIIDYIHGRYEKLMNRYCEKADYFIVTDSLPSGDYVCTQEKYTRNGISVPT